MTSGAHPLWCPIALLPGEAGCLHMLRGQDARGPGQCVATQNAEAISWSEASAGLAEVLASPRLLSIEELYPMRREMIIPTAAEPRDRRQASFARPYAVPQPEGMV